ncbi:MAG TPA: OmpH family outer membrane protein [Bacteroidales bacterium]|nr:OmpH family outer membrane protein [Bacteroidales bacterium]HNZ42871.1 OmpH family outer membrane protein [Bacteroidales bacterium]HPB25283.1 OmpH family outer membrane protein [Bacteroidales bacterium]HPI30363.1 OmpH family outer membrane protein [Bacteroidales bacterium]HQN15969.1 OmpH family outer membrane protein [Bacteroidales bacterium]
MNEETRNENQEPIPASTDEFIPAPQDKPAEPADVQKKSGNAQQVAFTAISILALAGVIVLFILFFRNKENTAANVVAPSIDKVTFAYVNTDTIMQDYDFVLDVQVELANFEKSLQNQYASRAKAFEKEYNDYIKRATAGLLTLDQQKKKEEELSKEQMAIQELESNLALQLQEEKLKRNMEVHDTIVNTIARYNKTKNFTFIFEKSYGGGLLFVHPAFDITEDILTVLNKEYEKKPTAGGSETEKAK